MMEDDDADGSHDEECPQHDLSSTCWSIDSRDSSEEGNPDIGSVLVQDSSHVTVAKEIYNINVYHQHIHRDPGLDPGGLQSPPALCDGGSTQEVVHDVENNHPKLSRADLFATFVEDAGKGRSFFERLRGSPGKWMFIAGLCGFVLCLGSVVAAVLFTTSASESSTTLILVSSTASSPTDVSATVAGSSEVSAASSSTPTLEPDDGNRILGYEMDFGEVVRVHFYPVPFEFWDPYLFIGLCSSCTCSVLRIGGYSRASDQRIGFQTGQSSTNSVSESFVFTDFRNYSGPVHFMMEINYTFVIELGRAHGSETAVKVYLDQENENWEINMTLRRDETLLRIVNEAGQTYFENEHIVDGHPMEVGDRLLVHMSTTLRAMPSVLIGFCNASSCMSITVFGFSESGDLMYYISLSAVNNCLHCGDETIKKSGSNISLGTYDALKMKLEVFRRTPEIVLISLTNFTHRPVLMDVHPSQTYLKVDSSGACISVEELP